MDLLLLTLAAEVQKSPLLGFVCCGLPLAAVVGGMIYSAKSSAKAEARLQQRIEKNRQAAEKSQREFDTLSAEVMNDLLQKHKIALCARRRLLVTKDVYGVIDEEPWHKELEYFMNRVVKDAFAARVAERSTSVEEAGASGTWLGKMLVENQSVLRATVEAHVEEMVQASGSIEINADAIQPAEFERFCADELLRAGWEAVVMGGTGDQGVDIIATRAGTTVVFQCKLYSQPVGNYAVQEVFTGLAIHRADFAAVVSNAGFTPSAVAAANQTGVCLLHHSQLRTFEPRHVEPRS